MRLLALGAHPDDLEIYAFGSLSAWRAMGAAVTLAVATDGAGGGPGDPAELRRICHAEAEAAADLLGARPLFLGLPDGRLMPDASLLSPLRDLIARTDPHLVVTHAPNDYHADHRALAAGVSQAVNFTAPVLWRTP